MLISSSAIHQTFPADFFALPEQPLQRRSPSEAHLQKVRTLEELPAAIKAAFHAICQGDCAGWFRSCGICVN